jgi:hypothetical protein
VLVSRRCRVAAAQPRIINDVHLAPGCGPPRLDSLMKRRIVIAAAGAVLTIGWVRR